MAQKVQVVLLDDVDGGEAAETVSFGLDGVSYEIDLSAANAGRLRDSLAEWIGHARRIGGRATTSRRRGAAQSSSPRANDTGAVREWARGHGFTVSDRGRISAEVRAAYDKANA